MSWNNIHKSMTGYDFKKEFSFKDVFGFTFKKGKGIESSSVVDLPRPWIWTRVLVIFVALILVNFFATQTVGVLIFPYLSILMAAVIPMTILTFLFEISGQEKLKILDLLLIFIFGSALSIISVAFTGFSTGVAVIDPMIISITEELAKIIPIFLALRYFKVKSLGLAFVVGFTVGAGFQVIETMGYSTCFGLVGLFNDGELDYSVMWSRLFGSVGSHALWGAIEAFAIMIAKKETYTSALNDKRFWIWIAIPVLGHYFWDLIALSNLPDWVSIILFAWIQLAFIMLLVLLLRVIIQSNLKPKEATDDEVK